MKKYGLPFEMFKKKAKIYPKNQKGQSGLKINMLTGQAVGYVLSFKLVMIKLVMIFLNFKY